MSTGSMAVAAIVRGIGLFRSVIRFVVKRLKKKIKKKGRKRQRDSFIRIGGWRGRRE